MSSFAPQPPQQVDPDAQQDQGGEQDPAISYLEKAAQLIAQFVQAEQDPQEKALGSKLLAQCHQIVGARDKERESAMGISPQLKFVQRQARARAGGASAGNGGY